MPDAAEAARNPIAGGADKRFCFDHLRRRSSTGDVIQAHLELRTRHTPGQVFDHFSSACKLGETGSWHRDSIGSINFVHTPEFAPAMHQKSIHSPEYLDVHGWVFTPSSFRLLFQDLNALGYISLNEVAFTDTSDCEFFIVYSNEPQVELQNRLSLSKQSLHEERLAFFP